MEIIYTKEHHYRCIEESKIETDCSAIYKAQDLELNRNVCIKCLKLDGDNSKEIGIKLQKAMLEVRAMVEISDKITHIPNILSTYFDEEKKTFYIIMQWILGTSLKEKMNVPELQFINWMMSLCDILSAMEKNNLYHKDIKPANIMIDSNNELFLIDFNISVSTPNIIEGTIHYKAPEMDKKSKYMARDKVDIFAIGVMLYEYYTKEVPKKTIEYAKNRERGNFEWDIFVEPLEKNPEMPKEINDIIIKCMKLDPKQRYRNSNELKYELNKAVRSVKNDKNRGFKPRRTI